MTDTGNIYEYELIDIVFEQMYETPEDESSYYVCEDDAIRATDTPKESLIAYDDEGVPMGRTRCEIKLREKTIKDFYAQWISENPEKKVWNVHLKSNILVKYLSINETYAKASRTYESTKAVFRLTEILSNAKLVKEELTKPNNKNQKSFSKILIMRYDNIKLVVGYQKSMQENVQYSITAPQQQ